MADSDSAYTRSGSGRIPWLAIVSVLLAVSVGFNAWFALQQRDQRQYAADRVESTANVASGTLLAVPRFLAEERDAVAYSRFAQARGWASAAQLMARHVPRHANDVRYQLANLYAHLQPYDDAMLSLLMGAGGPEDEARVAAFISIVEQAEAEYPGQVPGDADWGEVALWLERLNDHLVEAARATRATAASGSVSNGAQ